VQRRCADLGFELEGDELVGVYRALMAIADDRKILTDNDIKTVVLAARRKPGDEKAPAQGGEGFDRASAAPQPAMHESGYGHGV
jgi:hypothetical protein